MELPLREDDDFRLRASYLVCLWNIRMYTCLEMKGIFQSVWRGWGRTSPLGAHVAHRRVLRYDSKGACPGEDVARAGRRRGLARGQRKARQEHQGTGRLTPGCRTSCGRAEGRGGVEDENHLRHGK